MPRALVLLSEKLPAHPRELGPVLAPALEMMAYDVIAAFKRSPMLPFEELPDAAAEAAVRALEQAGASAAAVPSERLPAEPKVFQVHNADVEEGGLNVQVDLVGNMRLIAWNAFELINAVTITTTRRKTQPRPRSGTSASGPRVGGMRAGGLRFRPIRIPTSTSETEHTEVIAIWPQGADIEVRFHSNAFNFDYLNERLASSTRENMRILARDLDERVESALLGPGFLALAREGASPPEMTEVQLTRYNRWLLLRDREGI
jgi:hypothetical protein